MSDAPEGDNVLVSATSSGEASQTLTETYQAGATYELSALIARTDATSEASTFSLVFEDDDGNVLSSQVFLNFALPLNEFVEVETFFIVENESDAVGQNITVTLRFTGVGVSVAVDRVRVREL